MMSKATDILTLDLQILEVMVAEMEAYLASDATFWPLNREGLPPKLTIGGCLMRQFRLLALQEHLPTPEHKRLKTAIDSFNHLLQENVVSFENRAHDELHAHLREWTSYLRNMSSQVASETEHYANTVDTRLVINALMSKLQTPPYTLNAQLAEDVVRMDKYLKAQWQKGGFVLPDVWQAAYPADKYWWLYGHPKG